MLEKIYVIDLVRGIIEELEVATESTIARELKRSTDSVDDADVIGEPSLRYHLFTLLITGEITVDPMTDDRSALVYWQGRK